MIETYVLFSLYAGFLFFVALKGNTHSLTSEAYLLDCRRLTLPSFVATLVTTWYGGILGVGEFIYLNGISAWFVFGIPYYIFAFIFALFFASKIRAQNFISIPDMFRKTFDSKTSLVGSIFVMIITSPAPYILMAGVILSSIFNWQLEYAIILAAVFSTFYVYRGGFRSVVLTDKIQFILMFCGFLVLFAALIYNIDSPQKIWSALPDGHRRWNGELPLQEIIVWFFIASWTFIDPGFHQRVSAAKTKRIARNGILISIIFWFIFDMLTLWSGLYAKVMLKGIMPLDAYPEIAKLVLDPFFYGFFVISLLAIVMSTADSFTFISAQTFGYDISGIFNKNKIRLQTRIGLILTTLIALLLIWQIPTVVGLWYSLGSIFIPPLLLPIISVIYPKIRLDKKMTFIHMLCAFFLSFGWFIYGAVEKTKFLNIEPFFPGLVFSVVFYLVGITNLKRKRRD